MTSLKKLCIHGHFYQPPRIDPWFRELLPEGSAAPEPNWNQRILAQSYAPLAWARRKNDRGLITDMVNCYEWVSFNFGPTLLSWMESAAPACYARILEGDLQSLRRWGHGNAMAQCYHHMIMPLASALDKQVQLAWTRADFQARYNRDPEGLWLSEAAVDTATLDAVADAGFRFVVLAPRQAAAVGDLSGHDRIAVDEVGLDIHQPYAAVLPSGRSIAVFFYHGPLSQAVAFERLLENGERFWQRMNSAARPGLLALATDGETYGHHFPFGEMALAYALEQIRRGRGDLELTNFAAFLAENPPSRRVYLKEVSSWSCVHGVERWRTDCGCTDGGHPGWNQRWRAPLRTALEENKSRVDQHFFAAGATVFIDPGKALLEYGGLLAAGVSLQDFIAEHFRSCLTPAILQQGFDLLAMQEWAMCSLASCAWFFDEISRVEPLNALTYALRSMELAANTGAADWTASILRELSTALSNLPNTGTGADLWHSHVLPRSMDLRSWTMAALLLQDRTELTENARLERIWPGAGLTLTIQQTSPDGCSGYGFLTRPPIREPIDFCWRWEIGEAGRPWSDRVHVQAREHDGRTDPERSWSAGDLGWNRKALITRMWLERQAKAWWEEQQQFGSKALPHFLPWQEDQHRPTAEPIWTAHLPGLVWNFLCTARAPANQDQFLNFCRANWQSNAEFDSRLNAHILGLLSHDHPDWRTLTRIAQRIAGLGLPFNLWPMQNHVWELGPDRPEIRALAGPLGFCRQEHDQP